MNHILAVCDSESAYAYQLADYLTNKKGFPFQVQLFTSIENLKEFAQKQPLSVALVSEGELFCLHHNWWCSNFQTENREHYN